MRWIITPRLPGCQKIQPEAKTGFENDEAVLALPALRELIAAQKDMARLRRAAISGVLNVVKDGGVGLANGVESEAGRVGFFH